MPAGADWPRITTCLMASRLIADSIAYAKDRETFGKPLIKHQVIRHKIADMSARYEVTRWRSDAVNTHMPDNYAGTPRQYLFAAFRSGARMPLSRRHLRSVLRNPTSDEGADRRDDACLA